LKKLPTMTKREFNSRFKYELYTFHPNLPMSRILAYGWQCSNLQSWVNDKAIYIHNCEDYQWNFIYLSKCGNIIFLSKKLSYYKQFQSFKMKNILDNIPKLLQTKSLLYNLTSHILSLKFSYIKSISPS